MSSYYIRPPFPPPPLQPQPPPPPPSAKQLLQQLHARVDHINRCLGQLFQLLHTVNSKLNRVLDANDVEYNFSDDPFSPSSSSASDNMEED